MARRQAMASIILGLSTLLTPTLASRWTVTEWFVDGHTTVTDGIGPLTWKEIETVKPNFKPTATEALSITTVTNTYEDLEVVQIYLPENAVPDSAIQSTYTIGTRYTDYVQPEVKTAPKSCPTPFTYTSWQRVDIPREVVSQYTPRTVETSWTYLDDTIWFITAYLTEEVVPNTVTSEDLDLSLCINPAETGSSRYYGGGSGGGSSSSSDDDDHFGGWCHNGYGARCALRIWIIVVAAVIPALFLLGLVENYFWFRRLMLGKSTLRFGTICWVCLTLIVLCFTRSVPARSPEDQKKLKEAWANVPAGQRIKLWFKHGFRHRYPVELLGEHPNWRNGHSGPMVHQVGPNGGPGGAPAPQQGQGGWVYFTTENGRVQSQWYQNSPPHIMQGQQGTQVAYYPPSHQAGYPMQGYPPQGYPPGQPAPFGYPPVSPQSPTTPTTHMSAVVGEKTVSTPSPVPHMGYTPPPAQMQSTEQREMAVTQAPTPPSELGAATEQTPHSETGPEEKPEARSGQ